jgi:hypothetical protein
MTVTTTLYSPNYPSDWLKGESSYGVYSSRDRVTVLAGQGVLVTGTVLGQRTADAKLAVMNPAATDGTQNFAGILVNQAVDTTLADQPAVVVARDATVMHQGLVWGPNINTPQLRAAAAQQMKAQGVIDRQGA